MAESQYSPLSNIWKQLAESKDISERLANDLQEWAIEEEFDFDALIDDINDKEDESSISQWLKDQKYNKEDELLTIRKLITPQSYYDSYHSNNNNNNNNNKNQESKQDIQVEYNDEKQLEWSGLPRQVTIKQIIKQESPDLEPSPALHLPLNIDIDPSSPHHIKDLLIKLDKQLDFHSNPSLVQDIISQLQTYTNNNNNNNNNISNDKHNHETQGNDDDNDDEYIGVSGGDLNQIKSALKRLNEYTSDELDEFVRFCKDEEYGEDQLIDDIEVFEEGDSAIIENIASLFDWNSGKAFRFVNSLRNILGLKNTLKRIDSSYITMNMNNKITPNGDNMSSVHVTPGGYNNNTNKNKFTPTETDTLPNLQLFVIPTAIMKKKVGRSVEDIEACLRSNGISNKIINMFTTFCEEEKCDEDFMAFNEVTHGPKLRQEYPSIGHLLTQYICKCQYELRVPLFKASTFSKEDERIFSQYMEHECPGIIKHDRDLLRYFLLTKETEKDLSPLLIDIVDRISVNDEHPLDLKTFTNKPFFKELNKSQTSMIKNGLRTYHNRFFPRLTMNPLSLICDKISDYQKYSCILSHFVARIIEEKIITPPILIDFMIIPPGVYNKILNNFTAEKAIDLGDIKQHLNDFDNTSYTSCTGLNADGENNFNENIMNSIVNKLVQSTQKLMNILHKKQYQRIVIVIDRRWRILNKKHCLYNKLRSVHTNELYDHKIINKDTFDYKEYENDNGLTHDTGFEECDLNIDDDDDDAYDSGGGGVHGLFNNKSTSIDFKNKLYSTYINEEKINNDTMYVFQPKTPFKSRKLNEFSDTFCHETLMYLTKQCILPRKKLTLRQYKNINNAKKTFEKNKFLHDFDDDEEDEDEFAGLCHLSGDCADGYMFNLSVHIYNPYPNNIWYKYKLKWYLFTQSASIRVHQDDFNSFWFKYFVDAEKDMHKLNENELKTYFKFDLFEADIGFKRWYHAIKRTIN